MSFKFTSNSFNSFNSFNKLLEKLKTRLDISILSADKYLNSINKIKEFLNSEVKIEQKTDGVKVTVLRANNNWVISYKGNIIYDTEFNHLNDSDIKKYSIGSSQFKFVIDHFKKFNKKIEDGTELFIEFLMNKPTLSSNYSKKHSLVLIGYTKSKYKIKNGRLITQPGDFLPDRDKIAKEFNLDIPVVLFKGILGNKKFYLNSNPKLKKLFLKRENSFHWNNPKILITEIKQLFLDIESKYGGKEEGVVIIPKNNNFPVLKWQQDYQLDQEKRRKIKMQYIDDNPEKEADYWKEVRIYAKQIIQGIDTNQDFRNILKIISEKLKKLNINLSHSKKNNINILDDIQLTAKMMISKKLKGNNGALIIGKFRILTNAHYKIIQDALKKYDFVYIALTINKDTKETFELRKEMLQKCFTNINIIQVHTGNIITILNRIQDNINVVIAGSDRVEGYKKQLLKIPDIKIQEIKRNDNDISATKIITNINNKKYFIQNTPKCIHNYYNKLKEIYKKS